MGPLSRGRLSLLIVVFLLTALAANRPAGGEVGLKPLPLAGALARIDGWKLVRQLPLDPQVVRELQLDDYAFLTYARGDELVSLYVGYYFSMEKVGAAHHPLVCFSGQGWDLSPVRRQEFRLAEGTLPCAEMTAGREGDLQYIAYWFQAQDEAAAGPFAQKVRLARQKILQKGEESAFVRISLPVGERSEDECRRLAEEFVQAFYPVFLRYVRSQPA